MDAVANPDVKSELATDEPIVVTPYLCHQKEGTDMHTFYMFNPLCCNILDATAVSNG